MTRRIRFRIAAALAAVAALYAALRFSPYPALKAFRSSPISTVILDCEGQVVQIPPCGQDAIRREWVALSEMPPALPVIFINAEDKRFRRHPGVDAIAIVRSVVQLISQKRIPCGASTITMQLARIIEPRPNATKVRLLLKAREALNALRLEARLSKDQILEFYLNSVPFGFNTEGAASAARTFFSTPLNELTTEQMLCLAVIPRRPASNNPLKNPEVCAQKAFSLSQRIPGIKDEVTQQSILSACKSAHSYRYPFEMPHYVRHLQSLGSRRIEPRPNAPDVAPMLGEAEIGRTPVIRLSASLALQHMAEALLADEVARHTAGRISQGALLICGTQTGEVLSWVGSTDFQNASAQGQVDGVLARVQPGSAMKPFLYAAALDKGHYSPSTVLPDVPFEAGGAEAYIPQNFNNRYNGPVRLRVALASSLNIPAVYLLKQIGMEEYLNTLSRLHFTSLNEAGETLGLSLALGSCEVSLLEMVRAFSVFPRDGVFIPLTAASSATDYQGGGAEEVFDADTARLICSILSDAPSRALGFGYAKTFITPFPSIFKTGTANQYMSIAALAATKHYTAGVWMGNFDGNTVQGITGSAVPAAVARKMLVALEAGQASEPFDEPVKWQKREVCALSGMEATPLCPDKVEDYFLEQRAAVPCTWHILSNGKMTVRYPAEYAEYLALKRTSASSIASPLIILSPMDGSVFYLDKSVPAERQRLAVTAAGGQGEWQAVEDGAHLPISTGGDGSLQLRLPLTLGEHTLTVTRGSESKTVTWQVQ